MSSASGAPGFPRNILDEDRQGVLGRPVDRIDGPHKVSGRARYAYEQAGQGEAVYGFIVGAAIASGRIAEIDTREAAAAPGVLLVMTHLNAPPQAPSATTDEVAAASGFTFALPKPFLTDDKVRYRGEPVAFVVAETFEQARDAAARVRVSYADARPAATGLEGQDASAYGPKILRANIPTDSAVGDFEAAFADAPARIDAVYTTPFQHQHPMETHASLAEWRGDHLTLHVSAQLPTSTRQLIAATLQVPVDQVRILCRFVGGGFGSKLATEADAVLSALAARQLGRPVKTALTRQQTVVNAGHRSASIQRVRLAAAADGRLTALGHEALVSTATFDEFVEPAAVFSRNLYAAPNRRTAHRVARLDLPMPGDMRAPGEGTGTLALEQAMDELACALDLDPVELRIRNEPAAHPESGKPFSSRRLVDCCREGAQRFGWDQRPRRPASLRDGRWLVGYGMAAMIRNNATSPSKARASLGPDGRLRIETAMTDIGTGTYTILAQIAAEAMGLPLDTVTVEIGDTDLPPAFGSGGSRGANSSGSAVFLACEGLRARLAQAAGMNDRSCLGMHDGVVLIDGARTPLTEFMQTHAPGGLDVIGDYAPGETAQDYAQQAHGACFVEIGVDIDTGEPRLRRMLGVFAAGRILNAKTARSQAIGGLIWGLSAALQEETVADEQLGQFINNDLAGYHYPAHADVTNVEAVFLPQLDDKASPLKSKGIGELGICGSGAAVANAVYNACGVRVRDYPITLDKLILDPGFPLA
jgi:xanthine dehydrogenase YagR molybdenum-binding subunit